MKISVFIIFLLISLSAISLFVPEIDTLWVTSNMFSHQDIWILSLYIVFITYVCRINGDRGKIINVRFPHILPAILLVFSVCLIGHYVVLMGYDLSRDEQMANFDAMIFSGGRLVWPLPVDWRAHAAALNLEFMLPVERPAAWVSAYLPMNAALRAAAGMIADRSFAGPLMTAASLPLIWSIAARIWPSDREAPTIALLLLAGSGQFVITGMTAYAMPAHLLFNLLWLRLFLVRQRWSDALALAAGAIATGLHQPLFHPMFVAPFLFLTVWERDWRRAGLFAVGYAAIGLFWLNWPLHIYALVVGQGVALTGGGVDYASRLAQVLSLTWATPTLMAANLLRFVVWQHLLLIPLLIVGIRVARRDRFAAMLAVSLLLPIVVMAIILPYQGIGFGYRYLHGVLGSAVLLAVYGWRELEAWHPQLRASFLKATAASCLLLLPVQVWMAHARYAPYAQASAKIDHSGANYFLVESMKGPLVRDLAINRPDLSNRPIRLVAEAINDTPALARQICRPGITLALGADAFYDPIWAYFDTHLRRPNNRESDRLKNLFEREGCQIVLLP
jgi:hypothetical protein